MILTVYLKKWVPELKNISETWIHEPWKMELSTQRTTKCIIGRNYPAPIVDHTISIKKARLRIAEIIKKDGYKDKSKVVLNKMGSRKRTKTSKNINPQLQLL